MKVIYKPLLLTTFLICALMAQAQETVLTLKQAIHYALENNTPTSKAKLDEQANRYNIKEVKSQALPQVSAFGNFDNNLNIPVQLLPGELIGQPGTTVKAQFGKQYTVTGGAEINQKVFDHSVLSAMQAANASTKLYSLKTKKSKEDVIYQITSDYYQVLIQQEKLCILKSNQKKNEHLYDLAGFQHKVGVMKNIDLNRLKVNITNGETRIQNSESDLKNQMNTMKFHMGMDINILITLDAASDLLGESKVAEALAIDDVSPIRSNHQLIIQQQLLNEMEVKNFRSGYSPSLSAYARYSYNAQRTQMDFFDGSKPWFNATVVGLKLNVPIFDGFKKRAQVQQSQIRLQKLKYDESNVKRSIDLDYQNAINQFQNSQKSLESQKDNVVLAQEVYAITEDSYKTGIMNLSDLLNSETELLTANNNYNEAVLKLKLSQLQILQAKGQLLTILN